MEFKSHFWVGFSQCRNSTGSAAVDFCREATWRWKNFGRLQHPERCLFHVQISIAGSMFLQCWFLILLEVYPIIYIFSKFQKVFSIFYLMTYLNIFFLTQIFRTTFTKYTKYQYFVSLYNFLSVSLFILYRMYKFQKIVFICSLCSMFWKFGLWLMHYFLHYRINIALGSSASGRNNWTISDGLS